MICDFNTIDHSDYVLFKTNSTSTKNFRFYWIQSILSTTDKFL